MALKRVTSFYWQLLKPAEGPNYSQTCNQSQILVLNVTNFKPCVAKLGVPSKCRKRPRHSARWDIFFNLNYSQLFNFRILDFCKVVLHWKKKNFVEFDESTFRRHSRASRPWVNHSSSKWQVRTLISVIAVLDAHICDVFSKPNNSLPW